MEVRRPACAGLDVHASTVVAGVRLTQGTAVRYHPRTVPTTTRGLLDLAAWLADHGVTHVAMEATGVYWKPVWHALEGQAALILANAHHIRNIQGARATRATRRGSPTSSRSD